MTCVDICDFNDQLFCYYYYNDSNNDNGNNNSNNNNDSGSDCDYMLIHDFPKRDIALQDIPRSRTIPCSQNRFTLAEPFPRSIKLQPGACSGSMAAMMKVKLVNKIDIMEKQQLKVQIM